MTDKTSKLLMDERPLQVLPGLAVKLGVNEAIFLQQVHYWLIKNEEVERNFVDGRYWTYNSFEAWHKQLPFLSVSTIQRIVNKLKKKGYLITANYNKAGYDRTLWYSINYKKLDEDKPGGKPIPPPDVLDQPNEAILPEGAKLEKCGEVWMIDDSELRDKDDHNTKPIDPCGQLDRMDQVNLTGPIPETNQRIKDFTDQEQNTTDTTHYINHDYGRRQIRKLRDMITDKASDNGKDGFVSESPKALPKYHEDHNGNYP